MKNYRICIVGLGYVGLPLAVAFAEKFDVIAYDNDRHRINELEDGLDRTEEVDGKLLQSVKSNVKYTSDISAPPYRTTGIW